MGRIAGTNTEYNGNMPLRVLIPFSFLFSTPILFLPVYLQAESSVHPIPICRDLNQIPPKNQNLFGWTTLDSVDKADLVELGNRVVEQVENSITGIIQLTWKMQNCLQKSQLDLVNVNTHVACDGFRSFLTSDVPTLHRSMRRLLGLSFAKIPSMLGPQPTTMINRRLWYPVQFPMAVDFADLDAEESNVVLREWVKAQYRAMELYVRNLERDLDFSQKLGRDVVSIDRSRLARAVSQYRAEKQWHLKWKGLVQSTMGFPNLRANFEVNGVHYSHRLNFSAYVKEFLEKFQANQRAFLLVTLARNPLLAYMDYAKLDGVGIVRGLVNMRQSLENNFLVVSKIKNRINPEGTMLYDAAPKLLVYYPVMEKVLFEQPSLCSAAAQLFNLNIDQEFKTSIKNSLVVLGGAAAGLAFAPAGASAVTTALWVLAGVGSAEMYLVAQELIKIEESRNFQYLGLSIPGEQSLDYETDFVDPLLFVQTSQQFDSLIEGIPLDMTLALPMGFFRFLKIFKMR